MARLFIIGNGFDLHHNMKTKYSDYHNFLIEHKKIGDTIFFEMYPFKRKIEDTVDEDEILDMWWSDIEANSNFDFILWANSIDTTYSCPPFTNGNGYKQLQAKADINKARKFYKDDFRTWINSINYGECCDDIKELISKEDYFISFNYTLTLERLYNIPKDHILHIHGKIDDKSDLQFGSFKNNPKNVIEKLNEKYKDRLEDDDIKQMINNFGELAKEMYKEYDYNIDKLRTFIECIKDEISEVIVYGLAIKPEFMDKAYFENYLFEKFKDTQWVLYYKDHDSKDKQTAYMSKISFVKPFKQLPMKDNGS